MTPLLVWARRSVAWAIALVVLVALLAAAWSTGGWQYEWLWGMRLPAGFLPLISPLVAAGVAFDTSRRWAPLMTDLGPTALRWRRASLAVPAVHVLWAFAALCVAWAAAALRLWQNDAITRPDPWLPIEALAALVAAAAAGLVIGACLPDTAAPPVAAILVFSTAAFNAPFGLNGLFATLAPGSSAVGVTRDPRAALLLIGLNLAVAALCCWLALRGPRTSRSWLAGAAALAALVVAAAAVPPGEYDFRPVAGPPACASAGTIRVCGPPTSEPLVQDLSRAVQQAAQAAAGLPYPDEYELGIPGAPLPTDTARAVVFVTPARLAGDARDRTVANILASPRTCPQLLEGGPATTALLDRQSQVRNWIRDAVKAGGAQAPDPIRAAYDELLTCSPTAP